MKLLIFGLFVLLLSGCGSTLGSIFKIVPTSKEVCPHGKNAITNVCNP